MNGQFPVVAQTELFIVDSASQSAANLLHLLHHKTAIIRQFHPEVGTQVQKELPYAP